MRESDIIAAHLFSCNHMKELKEDKRCGCFSCLRIFEPKEIGQWIVADNDCDRDGTAVCPFCGIDSVIGESSGFPITTEFLSQMKEYWIDTCSGDAIPSPFGRISLFMDDRRLELRYRRISNNPKYFPLVDRAYRVDYSYQTDKKEHRLSFILETDHSGDIDSGERLEALTFCIGKGMITLGCEGSAMDYKDYDYDYDVDYLRNGVEIVILPETKTQIFHFGVAWRVECEDVSDVQTCFGADPFYR